MTLKRFFTGSLISSSTALIWKEHVPEHPVAGVGDGYDARQNVCRTETRYLLTAFAL